MYFDSGAPALALRACESGMSTVTACGATNGGGLAELQPGRLPFKLAPPASCSRAATLAAGSGSVRHCSPAVRPRSSASGVSLRLRVGFASRLIFTPLRGVRLVMSFFLIKWLCTRILFLVSPLERVHGRA